MKCMPVMVKMVGKCTRKVELSRSLACLEKYVNHLGTSLELVVRTYYWYLLVALEVKRIWKKYAKLYGY